MPIIYRIFNKESKKSYIGQTYLTLEQRFDKHKAKALRRNSSAKLAKAIRDQGIISFDKEILEEINSYDFDTPEELQIYLDSRELYWISHFNSIDEGYNVQNHCQGIRDIHRTSSCKISEEELKHQFLIENKSREEIRKTYRLSKGHFHRLVKKWGLEKDPAVIGTTSAITKMKDHWSQPEIDQFKDLYFKNTPIKQISKQIGRSTCSIYRLRDFLGVTR